MKLINKISVDNNQELQTDTAVQIELEEKPVNTINSKDNTEMEFDATPQNYEELDSIMPELWSTRLDDRRFSQRFARVSFFQPNNQ